MDKISALMDGELDGHQARAQIDRLKHDDNLAHSWHVFHKIGDAMRGERELSDDFGSRLSARLKAEPTVLAPRISAPRRFVTYALSAAASLSAIALVGWVALSGNPLAPEPAQVAKVAPAAPPTPAAVSAPVAQLASTPSDGTMNEYILAHQGFSPSTSIQGVAPYIRSVSISQPSEGR